MVPWPAMMSGSSNGGTNTAPRSAANRLAAAMQSSTASPPSLTVAPYPVVASTLGSGALEGMKMVARCPVSVAASATPWAWLPAEAATTSVPGSRREMRL